jgi:dihydrofolate reductase
MEAHILMQHDLVDEFRISICPIVLGGGIPLFHHIRERMKLELLDSRTFQSGVVVLHYRVGR